ncbi:unnamed protein product [Schistocephalus solidus]|uniref:C2H2-type domain-containing protein n=1 Tax=Schistocephalus solidus TaxID=70667 RepID=A0A183TRF4_SCHSO|nr:unnamed protein product [Schistocephalus solidus]
MAIPVSLVFAGHIHLPVQLLVAMRLLGGSRMNPKAQRDDWGPVPDLWGVPPPTTPNAYSVEFLQESLIWCLLIFLIRAPSQAPFYVAELAHNYLTLKKTLNGPTPDEHSMELVAAHLRLHLELRFCLKCHTVLPNSALAVDAPDAKPHRCKDLVTPVDLNLRHQPHNQESLLFEPQHVSEESTQNPWRRYCQICRRGFSSPAQYSQHLKNVHKNKRFLCPDCGMSHKSKVPCLIAFFNPMIIGQCSSGNFLQSAIPTFTLALVIFPIYRLARANE